MWQLNIRKWQIVFYYLTIINDLLTVPWQIHGHKRERKAWALKLKRVFSWMSGPVIP